MTRKLLKIALVVLLSVVSISIDAQEKPVLWYDKPARYWEEALPLGNGRLGAMVYGNPVTEEIQLNEETVSAGSPCIGGCTLPPPPPCCGRSVHSWYPLRG